MQHQMPVFSRNRILLTARSVVEAAMSDGLYDILARPPLNTDNDAAAEAKAERAGKGGPPRPLRGAAAGGPAAAGLRAPVPAAAAPSAVERPLPGLLLANKHAASPSPAPSPSPSSAPLLLFNSTVPVPVPAAAPSLTPDYQPVTNVGELIKRARALRARLGRPLRVILFDGSGITWDFIGNTPPFGDIQQWTDVLTALLAMGVEVSFVFSKTQMGQVGAMLPQLDFIFSDYIGAFDLNDILVQHQHEFSALQDNIFILDSFGTDARFNYMSIKEAEGKAYRLYCCRAVPLHHILTMVPLHGSGNQFIGYIVPPPAHQSATAAAAKRDMRVILYGKMCHHAQAVPNVAGVIEIFQRKGFEVVSTMSEPCHILPNTVTSLGVVPQDQMRRLLQTSRVFMGMGKPLIGPGAVEAVVEGLSLLLPEYSPPIDCTVDEELAEKPNCVKWRTQHPMLEMSLEEPRAFIFNYADTAAAENVASQIAALPDSFFHPQDVDVVTGRSFLHRIASVILSP